MRTRSVTRTLACVLTLATSAAGAAPGERQACNALPSHAELKDKLTYVTNMRPANGGLGNEMWATIVNRDGVVCAVAFSGLERGDQWPGSRVISAQKANTANAFSLNSDYPNVAGVGRALASGNLYGLVQPGGSLFGLQMSNPVDPSDAYGGNAKHFGQPNDPLVGNKVGGVNVFGGGLALYDEDGNLVGALGVSGDTSCADHVIAWRVRDALGKDHIPGGVGDGFANDNLILADPVTPNTFEHPVCGFGEDAVISDLAVTNPIGDTP